MQEADLVLIEEKGQYILKPMNIFYTNDSRAD